MSNILIVGASGFLGSQLLYRLQDKKNIVVFAPSHKEMDALDLQCVENYIREKQIDYVFSFALQYLRH